ncbi:MAG TPA: 50S ribosomal protein L30 [Candidatus Pelethocola excrementipullorum]|nr:50S ribosomal protein L30 [Candidatus Pelethocola excrementipullorum]
MADKLKVTLVKSTIGAIPKHRKTVEALGLRKLNKTVELPDNVAVRGMVKQVCHLVKVEEA